MSFEVINDWPSFSGYCGTELYKRIIDIENLLLIQGDSGTVTGSGTTETTSPTGMVGLMDTPGILNYDATPDTGGTGSSLLSALDSVEKAIAEMRVEPALAVPDLIVLNPETWSAIRRIKDGFGRFQVAPDPTTDQASELWAHPFCRPRKCRSVKPYCWTQVS